MKVHVHFKFAHVLKLFKIHVQCVQVDTMDPSLSNSTPMDLLNATENSSPCNSMPMNLLSTRDRLRLERQIASGETDDAYGKTNVEQWNSPCLGRQTIRM